ncbi:MAG: hypothetical protein R3C56_14780 [Pirellulaceae bacterium]|jgi:pyruvate dehydrogenase E1 component
MMEKISQRSAQCQFDPAELNDWFESLDSVAARYNPQCVADLLHALHPDKPKRRSYVEHVLDGQDGPFIAVTDYIKLVPDQIRQWIPGRYMRLGTDGFGRSDTRTALRSHFEVDAEHIVYATLLALSKSSDFEIDQLTEAMSSLGIEPESMDPAIA